MRLNLSFLRIFPISLFFFFLDIKKGLDSLKPLFMRFPSHLIPNFPAKSLFLFFSHFKWLDTMVIAYLHPNLLRCRLNIFIYVILITRHFPKFALFQGGLFEARNVCWAALAVEFLFLLVWRKKSHLLATAERYPY